MPKIYSQLLSLTLLLPLAGCLDFGGKPPMTPLEIQSIQTREFEASKDVVFHSVIAVFQDLGYTVSKADKESGLIKAESTAQSRSIPTFRYFDKNTRSEMDKVTTSTKATAVVEAAGKFSRVRLNFVKMRQTSSAAGQVDRADDRILDAKTYQNAFERIDEAVFMRSQG